LALEENTETLTALAWRLNTHSDYFYFKRSAAMKTEYACREEMPQEETNTAEEELQDRMEQNAAMALVDEAFPAASGLYRKGYNLGTGVITLYFNFPQVAEKQYHALLNDLSATTGWFIEVNQEANHNALAQTARQLLPAGWSLLKNPAIHRLSREVHLKCELSPENESQVKEVAHRFTALTGYQLIIQTPGSNVPVNRGQPQKSAKPAANCLEINATYAIIRTQLQEAGATFSKIGKRLNGPGEFIEVSFISPVVGRRYQEVLDRLEKKTGWPIKINPKSNQNEIKAIVRAELNPAWGLAKEPSFFEEDNSVVVKLKEPPAADNEEWIEVVQKIFDLTGCRLAK